MIERRGFLAGILAAGMAPAIVRAGILMPVQRIWTLQEALEDLTSSYERDVFQLVFAEYRRALVHGTSLGHRGFVNGRFEVRGPIDNAHWMAQ